MTDLLGKRFGNYYIVRFIGEGSFADVYLAEHEHLGTQAAIKILHPRLTKRAETGEFIVEARTVAHLKHPHIIRVLEFGVQDDTPFLVLDYAPNGTLHKLFPKGITQPPAKILPYVKQIAAALQYAHDRKLIHRDVKPANILLGSDNEVLLSDFGLALITRNTGSLSMSLGAGTSDNKVAIAGTPDYMAPEQFTGKPCRASDQYALAVMVYEWLSGVLPFHGTSFFEVADQHMHTLPPPLDKNISTISPAIERVVLKALAKEPRQRFARIQDFASALEQAIAPAPQPQIIAIFPPTPVAAPNTPIHPAPPVIPPSPAQPQLQSSPRISRRAIITYGGGSVVLLALVATAGIITEEVLASNAQNRKSPVNGTPPAGATKTATPAQPTATTKVSSTSTTTPSLQTLANDTFNRRNQQLWGTASDGQVWQGDANNPSNVPVFSINNNTGQIKTGATAGQPTYRTFLGASYTNATVSITGSVNKFVAPAYLAAMLRWTWDKNNAKDFGYKAVLDGTNLFITKRNSPPLRSVPFRVQPGTAYTLKFQNLGTTLQAKAWETSKAEPGGWMLTVTDNEFLSGLAGIRIQLVANMVISITSFSVTTTNSQ